jgi:hypothetical protein
MKTALIAAIVSAVVAASVATATTTIVITGAQIKNGSIQLQDLSPRAKRALKGQRGPRGFQGATGLQGTPGAAGVPGPKGTVDPNKVNQINGAPVTIVPGGFADFSAFCAPGQLAISGGATLGLGGTLTNLNTYPHAGEVKASVVNNSSFPLTVFANAVCVTP